MMSAHPLRTVGALTRAMSFRAKADPWRCGIPWLPIQLRYQRSQQRFRLFRAGNQALGKTTAALADLIGHATGLHPSRTAGRTCHGEYWVVCASWSQSIAIQGKLHDLMPPERLHPDAVFQEATGYRGKNPSVRVRHEDGCYSIIRFKTTNQGTLSLAGSSVDGVLFDEPPASQALFSEVMKRVSATGGWLSIAMTPVGAPVDWLKAMVDADLIEDIHSPLTPDALIPVGCSRPRRLPDGTVCDEEWIAEQIAMTPEHEVPVRIHGEWEMRVTKRVFEAFRSSGDQGHVHERVPRTECRIVLGIDHGTKRAGDGSKQIGVLVLVDQSHWTDEDPENHHSRIYVLDEFSPIEDSTPEQDAKGILAMLKRYGLEWKDIDRVFGDRVYVRGAERKSNGDLQAAIARRLKTSRDRLVPSIRTVKRGAGRGAGSVDVGVRYLHHQMVRSGGFGIHPRCKRLIEALDRYDFRDNEFKDPIDALRYALDEYVFGVVGPNKQQSRTTLRVR